MTSHKAVQTKMHKCGQKVDNSNQKCEIMLKTEHELHDHIKSTHKKQDGNLFRCNKCEKVFTLHKSLLQHAKIKHEDTARLPVGHQAWNRRQENEKFCCTSCPAEFKLEGDLKDHVSIHDDVFVIACEECEEIFETRNDLSHHTRLNHEGFKLEKRLCRYFQQGRCFKGIACLFSHEFRRNATPQRQQVEQPPACRRGLGCEFLARGN